MTINVWSGLTYRGVVRMESFEPDDVRERRFSALVACIRELSPDVIAVNEANPLPFYAKRLAAETGCDFVWHIGVSGLRLGPFGVPVNLREGDVILARRGLSLRFAGRVHLGGGGFAYNHVSMHTGNLTQAVLGSIRVHGRDVYIAVTHWHASPRLDTADEELERLAGRYGYTEKQLAAAKKLIERDRAWKMKEAVRLAAWLEKKVPPGSPLIVMGDLNAEHGWPETRHLLDRGFRDVFSAVRNSPGSTWDPARNGNLIKHYRVDETALFENPYDHLHALDELEPRRIDYILVNDILRESDILDAGLCCTARYEGVYASDHFGVFARIRV